MRTIPRIPLAAAGFGTLLMVVGLVQAQVPGSRELPPAPPPANASGVGDTGQPATEQPLPATEQPFPWFNGEMPLRAVEPNPASAGRTCPWAHRCSLYGEFLYVRPRNAEVAYAVPIDGGIVPPPIVPVQAGPVANTDPAYGPAFRVGFWWALDESTSLGASYTRLEGRTESVTSVAAPLVLRSLVFHPGTANAGSDFLDASATADIDLHLVNVDYRAVWKHGDLWAINYRLGAGYAGLEQQFHAVYSGTGTVDRLDTSIGFDGAGPRIGLDAERHACNCGLLLYARGTADFLVGEFRGRYTQSSDVDPVIVDTAWKAGRIVPVLDLEIGTGWQSYCGHYRFTAGYFVSVWCNSVTTNQWIPAVQNDSFVGLGDVMTFDGFTARFEYRF